jgi:uncharacterized protein with PIN domain
MVHVERVTSGEALLRISLDNLPRDPRPLVKTLLALLCEQASMADAAAPLAQAGIDAAASLSTVRPKAQENRRSKLVQRADKLKTEVERLRANNPALTVTALARHLAKAAERAKQDFGKFDAVKKQLEALKKEHPQIFNK